MTHLQKTIITKETEAQKEFHYEEVADKLTATEFRKYGETSPTVCKYKVWRFKFH